MKIELEDWQVKQLREYFGKNDSTQLSHWAYVVFDKAHKKQSLLNSSCEQLKDINIDICSCGINDTSSNAYCYTCDGRKITSL